MINKKISFRFEEKILHQNKVAQGNDLNASYLLRNMYFINKPVIGTFVINL